MYWNYSLSNCIQQQCHAVFPWCRFKILFIKTFLKLVKYKIFFKNKTILNEVKNTNHFQKTKYPFWSYAFEQRSQAVRHIEPLSDTFQFVASN